MAQSRSAARRAIDRRRRQRGPAERVLHGRHRRRPLEDDDGGTTWRAVTDGQIHSSSIGAVAIAPSNPDVVYIGTGESDIRGNIIQGDGAYKTTDAGKTWTHIGLGRDAGDLEDSRPSDEPGSRLRRRFGHHAAPNPERGVFRSKDGGKTWDKILFRDNKTGAIELILDPGNPQVIYAALWEAYRNSWEMSSGGPGSGIFKTDRRRRSLDGDLRNPGLPKAMLGKIGLSVSGADSNRVYAQIEAETAGSTRPTTPARRGRKSRNAAIFASVRSTTRASTPIPRRRTSSTC
jgi:hypothetical protein